VDRLKNWMAMELNQQDLSFGPGLSTPGSRDDRNVTPGKSTSKTVTDTIVGTWWWVGFIVCVFLLCPSFCLHRSTFWFGW